MMLVDPDQISTQLLRRLETDIVEDPTGTFLVTKELELVKELEDEGYGEPADREGEKYRSRLNGRGTTLLKIIRGQA